MRFDKGFIISVCIAVYINITNVYFYFKLLYFFSFVFFQTVYWLDKKIIVEAAITKVREYSFIIRNLTYLPFK